MAMTLRTLVLLGLLALTSPRPCWPGTPQAHHPAVLFSQEWMALSKHPAFQAGKTQALKDFKSGRYLRLVYGLRSEARSEPDRFLENRYQVKTVAIAGCIVTEGLLNGAQGYNETMQALLIAKHGKDIFKEAAGTPPPPN